MLKFLILFPFVIFAGAIGCALLVPLIAIVPLLLVVGVAIALPLLILRVLFAVFFGLGHLFVGLLGAAAMLVGLGFFLVVGVIGLHLLFPLLLLAGLIWLIRRSAHPAPLQLEQRPG
jgi:hypothetical protein